MMSLRATGRLVSRRFANAGMITSTTTTTTTSRSFAVSARVAKEAPAAAAAPVETDLAPKSTTTEIDGAAPPATDLQQAPNRTGGIWTRNQQPREQAMTGPRFEQTDFSLQPQPWSAMELIHQQPVNWTHDRIVACDGGGGAAGHPRVFINTDKPQICVCGYCGLPFANEHHRKHLESLPQTSYPLA